MAVMYVAGGSLDASSLRLNRDDFERLARVEEDVTIDMSDVSYMDPSGVGALVFVLKRVRAAGREFKLINARGQPRQLLEQVGLTQKRFKPFQRSQAARAPVEILPAQAELDPVDRRSST